MKTTPVQTIIALILSLSLTNLDGSWFGNSASASEMGEPAERSDELAPSEPGVSVISSGETGIVLELYTPDFHIEPLVVGGTLP
jgi:hypothetical protein